MIYTENILLCIVIPLLAAMLFIKGSARRFVLSFITGIGVCLLSAYISGFIEYAAGMGSEKTSIFISPVVEEIMKFLPVLFYLLILEPKNDELLLAAVGIGAGFATFENCCYILTAGSQRIAYIMIRGFAVGVMHLVSMVALTMGITMLKNYKVYTFAGMTGALSLAMSFHAMYNLLVSKSGVSSYIGYVMPVVCAVLLYVQYRKIAGYGEE